MKLAFKEKKLKSLVSHCCWVNVENVMKCAVYNKLLSSLLKQSSLIKYVNQLMKLKMWRSKLWEF